VRILGLEFFDGTTAEAVDRALNSGGLIVAPSGTCFQRLQNDEIYRAAMAKADQVLPDSGFMVLLWRILRGGRLPRISGLAYLEELLTRPDLRAHKAALWILPNHMAHEKTISSLDKHGFPTGPEHFYVAPMYDFRVEDPVLLARIQTHRPAHVVIGLSGGVQEKLGAYLYENAGYRVTIHCIGAALGFITGYQTAIPSWADRIYLGWFFRFVANPRVLGPRLWQARTLPHLISKYGDQMPPLRTPG
jgi:N-acetylglucosaminyldiphosphoundecaprenol N-acetyl-beta-D-mannosaminyltransferase